MISNLIIDTMPGNPWSPDKANFGVYQTSEFQGKDKVTRVALQEHMTLLEATNLLMTLTGSKTIKTWLNIA